MKTNKQTIKRSILLIGFLSLFISTNLLAIQYGKVEGKLVNPTNQKPIEFATVTLIRLPDSTVVQGAITDTAGIFKLNDIPYGNYVAKISCLGFKKFKKDGIVVSSSENSLGTLAIEESSTNINEVVVEGERLKGTAEVDKTVYAINEKAIATATNGLEVLRNVPAVQVDFQNNVTLEGSGKILILVDGKTRDKEFLAQLDPKSIDKIEVMTNPSVKYDADVTGVISIILKKEKKSGFSGRFEAELPLNYKRVFSNSSANFEYGYNRFHAFVSEDIHLEKWDIGSPLYRKSISDGKTIELNQDGNGVGHFLYGGMNYGFDYFINDKNTFNFYANYRPDNGSKLNLDLTKTLSTDGVINDYIQTGSNDKSSDESQYYSVFYRKNFTNAGQELTADLNYYTYNGTIDRTYVDQDYLSDKVTKNGASETRLEKGLNQRDVMGLKLDYTQPINANIKAYFGYQTNTQWINNKNYTSSDLSNPRFRYNENRHAFYASLSGKIKEFNWQGGARFEMSNIEINRTTKSDYNCFLPQISLQQKINKTQSVKLNYRRSINRPGVNDLTPFVNEIDAYTFSKGNPDLDPSYSNKVELNYSIQLGSSFLTPGIYCDYFTGAFQQVPIVEGNITNKIVENVGTGTEIGFNVSGSVNLAKWWQLYPYFCVFDKKIDAMNQYGIEGAEKLSWRTSFSNVFTLPKKIVLFTYTQYNSPFINIGTTTKRFPIYVFGGEKEVIKDGKGKLTLIFVNPFMKRFTAQETINKSKDYYEHSKFDITDISYLFTVKFTYVFQSGKTIKKLDRQKDIETDGAKRVF